MSDPRERRSWSRFQKRRRTSTSRRLSVEVLEDHILLSALIVTQSVDDGSGDTAHTLSWAIDQVNDSIGDEIDFSVGTGGPQSILITGALPHLTLPVVINGLTQPGNIPAGEEPIMIDGSGVTAKSNDGLTFDMGSGGSLVTGLAIGNFTGNAIVLNSGSNTIAGDDIGTNQTASAAEPDGGNGISVTTSYNTIGGVTAAARDVISNDGGGVAISGGGEYLQGGQFYQGGDFNVVEGNDIGTDGSGKVAMGDGAGVAIGTGSYNTIGGTAAGARNVISGNMTWGVELVVGYENLVEGDYIGTDFSGTEAIPNGTGVELYDGTFGTTIGGTTDGARDLISGNTEAGVELFGGDSTGTGNVVEGDYIGTNVDGTGALGNGTDGIEIDTDGVDNTVGGTTAGARNVISGNGANDAGVFIEGQDNLVEGNFIGTDFTGTVAVGNGVGVEVTYSGSSNTIGGTTALARNVISGNDTNGVEILGAGEGPVNNVVDGDYIGTDLTGALAVGNGNDGVYVLLDDESGETIGGTTAGAGDVISGNMGYGVEITYSTDIVVEGDMIGTDVAGRFAPGHEQAGITIDGDSSENTIGGATAEARNVISGGGSGVYIFGGPFDNVVEGDYIGTDVTGALAVANGVGVYIDDVASTTEVNTIGGTTAETRNVISGNRLGVFIQEGTSGSLVEGNDIGIAATGNVALGNTLLGIELNTGASGNTIGGTASGAGNVIADNLGKGVIVGDSDTDMTLDNAILGNSIYGNAGLGIELGDESSPLQIPVGGTGSGPNNLQNAPVLSTSLNMGSTTTIAFTLSSTPGTYRIEFFSNPSGTGQGETYLGFVNETINSTGQGSFTFAPSSLVAPGLNITATATDAKGNTSEFSTASTVATGSVGKKVLTNVTNDLSVKFGGFVFNRKTAQFTQSVTITNSSGAAITGPIEMVLANLKNATLVNQSGVYSGSSYITILSSGSLGVGQSLTFSLVFADPTLQSISDTAEFLAGPIPPQA
jgi:hypothetical protein